MKGMLPKPTAILMASTSCDAQTAVNELMSNYRPWADVPRISVDASFEKDEASMAYLGRQLMDCIPFIEKATRRKLDLDRLRDVCEESNFY